MTANCTPTVSVIVPNYNHARFLRQRLDTILAQTYQDFELILLDDSSTDDSLNILREYASNSHVSHLEVNERNSGSTFRQWNKGVRLARGKHVWIAESDDYADLNFLKVLVDVLENDESVVFAYCRSLRVDEYNRLDGFADSYLADLGGDRWAADFYMAGDEMCRTCFAQANPVPNASSLIFRRGVYEDLGGADETLRLCGDWKVWASMALKGAVAYRCEPMNYFRHHTASVRQRSESSNERDVEFLHLYRWVSERVTVPGSVRNEICAREIDRWVRLLLSFRTPAAVKRRVAVDAWALDPHFLRRAARPALHAVRLKTRHHWNEVLSTLRSGTRRKRTCRPAEDLRKSRDVSSGA